MKKFIGFSLSDKMKTTRATRAIIGVLILFSVLILGKMLAGRERQSPFQLEDTPLPKPPVRLVEPSSKDAGKDCTDNKQCEHACLANETVRYANDKDYVYHGKCAPTFSGLCRMQVKDGKLFDNPLQMCAD